jgi:NAD(P)-dependent dehydrogenase (short-subunit alcohol dehydrogenase family)
VIAEVLIKYGKLNILVNNAGIAIPGRIEELSLSDWNLQMNINATGVYLGTKYAIEAMKNNGELCSIINIASVNALVGQPDFITYDSSKGTVRAFSRTAALSCCEAGYTIRVNSIYPGVINTPMVEQEAKDQGVTIEQYLEEYVKMHPIGHLGEPKDVAYGVLYLASDESKFVTGAELVIDGGRTAK